MKKKATSSTRKTRKRKQPDLFSPPSRKEERDIMHALQLSIRKIPSNGEISEDEVGSDDEDFVERETEDKGDEIKDEPGQYETKWSKRVQAIEVNAFTQPSGPTKTLPSRQDVKNFFELMFDKKVWYHLCKQTNLYAKQRIALNPDPKWKPLGVGELKSWVGCLIAMGLSKKNNIRMYWEPPWRLSVVADRFTEDRFMAIKKYLHLADNTAITALNTDRLAKIRPFLNLLLRNFSGRYVQVQGKTCDETIHEGKNY